MTTPQGALERRLADALGAHDVEWDDREAVQDAYIAAGGETATWDDLPTEVQALIEQIEQLPRTSWDDPADVPGDI